MKYKFYEDTEALVHYTYHEQRWADIRLYQKEIAWICKHTGRDFNKYKINDVRWGLQPVMFYEGHYAGYLDEWFYVCYDRGDFNMWWGG